MDREALVRELEADGLFVLEWTDSPGTDYPEHTHPGREVRVVLEGAMTIWTSAGERTLGPGDRLELAPGEPHRARVGPQGVRYLAASDRRPGDGTGSV